MMLHLLFLRKVMPQKSRTRIFLKNWHLYDRLCSILFLVQQKQKKISFSSNLKMLSIEHKTEPKHERNQRIRYSPTWRWRTRYWNFCSNFFDDLSCHDHRLRKMKVTSTLEGIVASRRSGLLIMVDDRLRSREQMRSV